MFKKFWTFGLALTLSLSAFPSTIPTRANNNQPPVIQNIPSGSTWEFVGEENFTVTNASSLQSVIDSSGIPYIAYIDYANNRNLVVKRYVNNTWEDVGNITALGLRGSVLSDFVFGPGGELYLAVRAGQYQVLVFDGSTWETSTTFGFPGSYQFYVHQATEELYLYTNYPAVWKLENGTWNQIGDVNFDNANYYLLDATMGVVSDEPTLFYAGQTLDYNIGGFAGYKFDGTNWVAIPPLYPTRLGDMQSAVYDNKMYIAATYDYAPSFVRVYEYDGINRRQIGEDLAQSQFTGDITITELGEMLVSFKDFSNNQELVIKKFLEGEWQEYEIASLPVFIRGNTVVNVANNGDIYVAYNSDVSGGQFPGSVIKVIPGPIEFTTVEEKSVGTIIAQDVDQDSITYALAASSDANNLEINSQTGELSFVDDPDFENPTDTDQNNVYEIEITVTDGLLVDTSDVLVRVDQAPGVTLTPLVHTVTEGQNSLFEISLTTQPTSNVTVEFSGLLPSTSLDNLTTNTPNTTQVTFTPSNFDTPQQIRIETEVTPAETLEVMALQSTVTSADSSYAGITPKLIEVTILDSVLTDQDTDNVADGVEQAGPNDGDANADGIPDYLQGNVASLLNLENEYVTLINETCAFSRVEIHPESHYGQDPKFDYPGGLIEFESPCASVDLVMVSSIQAGTLRKYNSNFFPLSQAVIDTVEVADQTRQRVAYTVTDGDSLDVSLPGDSIVIDPVGFGVAADSSEESQDPPLPADQEDEKPADPSANETEDAVEGPETLIRTGGYSGS